MTQVSDQLDATFLALADPTRRAILARLALGEASVAELAEPFVISVGQDAQRRPRRLEGEPLAEASAWLEQYRDIWEASFQRLDALLDDMQRTSSTAKRTPKRGQGTRRRKPGK